MRISTVIASFASDRSHALRGVVLILIATAAFSAVDAIVRHISSQLHPFEIFFFRNLLGGIPVLVFCLRQDPTAFQTQQLKLYGVRALVTTTAIILVYFALSLAPLVEVTALGFLTPLFTILLAKVLLREYTSPAHWLSLSGGILGTLMILRPGWETISPGSLSAIISAAFFALTVIVIKTLARTDSSLTIALYMTLMQTPLSLLLATGVWRGPEGSTWIWLVLLGLLGTLGQITSAQAYKETDVVTLAPLDFTALIWASLFGFWFFQEYLDLWTYLGGGVIFLCSLIPLYARTKSSPWTQPDPKLTHPI